MSEYSEWSTPISFTTKPDDYSEVKILANTGLAAGDNMGFGLAMNNDGSLLFVGVPGRDTSKGTNSGQVLVYKKSTTDFTYTLVGTLDCPETYANGAFGQGIACSGDGTHLLVSGPSDYNLSYPGYVYYFTVAYSGGVPTFTFVQKFTGDNSVNGNTFGRGMACNDACDRILVGANNRSYIGNGSGLVYYFTRTGSVWTQQAMVATSDLADGDNLGSGIGMNSAGDYAVIGAYGDDVQGTNTGSAYIFKLISGVWTQESKINPTDYAASDYFGMACAMQGDGNRVFVSSPYNDFKGGNAGVCFAFAKQAVANWPQKKKMYGTTTVAGDAFGQGVAVSRDGAIIAVGAPYHDGPYGDIGCVYIFQH